MDTPSEALALSIGEKAKVDVPFMVQLCGKPEHEITDELAGAIFRNPVTQQWETSDEYLSGNVREKLATAETFAANHAEYQINVDYLKRVQPKDLDASEIEVRLGANWVKPEYITQFMKEVFKTPNYYAGIDIKARLQRIMGIAALPMSRNITKQLFRRKLHGLHILWHPAGRSAVCRILW